MRLPGFTAEAALAEHRERYWGGTRSQASDQSIRPAQFQIPIWTDLSHLRGTCIVIGRRYFPDGDGNLVPWPIFFCFP